MVSIAGSSSGNQRNRACRFLIAPLQSIDVKLIVFLAQWYAPAIPYNFPPFIWSEIAPLKVRFRKCALDSVWEEFGVKLLH